jgi:uncharacterized repeat protein (TIGR04052 family)
MKRQFKLNISAAGLVAVTLVACGGGGGSDTVTVTPALSGTAAVGAAIVGGTVSAKCVSGTPETGKTTGADGSYSIALNGATAPCILEVSSGTISGVANSQKLHGFATASGTVNITPLTEMALAHALGGTPETQFASINAGAINSANGNLAAAKTYVLAQLTALGIANPSADIFTGAFKVGDSNDQVLDALGSKLKTNNASISDLVKTASAKGSVTAGLAKPVTITFAAVNGITPVACGTQLTGMGTTAVAADIKDFRFYITNLALVDDKGQTVPVKLDANTWQLTQNTESVSLIDLENNTGVCATANNTTATNNVITGTVPDRVYVGMKASMGVPETMNHSAITGGVAPLDIAATAWSWQSGRKFAKIELNPVGGIAKTNNTTIATFNFHLGSTGCTAKLANGIAVLDSAGNPVYTCTNPNVMDFSLASFDPTTQNVALDIGKLFSTSNLTQETGGAAGCMSGATDPECGVMFNELKINFGSGSNGLSINGGAGQTIFKAIAK